MEVPVVATPAPETPIRPVEWWMLCVSYKQFVENCMPGQWFSGHPNVQDSGTRCWFVSEIGNA